MGIPVIIVISTAVLLAGGARVIASVRKSADFTGTNEFMLLLCNLCI
ncbi:MAG: hypothetical protein WCK92_11595 [Bacteroidota bacterium]